MGGAPAHPGPAPVRTRSASPSSPASAASLPPRAIPVVRPAPARQGQPASHRNFDQSSAGGAVSHVGYAAGPPAAAPAAALQPGDRRTSTHELSAQQARKVQRWGPSYIPAEETIRNDYAGQYVQTGARPQNYLRNTAVETRFNEYPKLATLLAHKHALTASLRHSIPPTYLNLPDPSGSSTAAPSPSPMAAALSSLAHSRFDCILLTPPPSVTYAELAALDLSARASTPSFVWLWVGSGQTGLDGVDGGGIGLERGRELLASWGYRRCEDIVWLKTNRRDPEADLVCEPVSLFNPTIEHCLMGIRGTVRRSTDSFLVHCNVDTDVIVWEGDASDSDLKPPELQSLIENFCLGTRRLHLYGSSTSLRRGWLTLSAQAGKETFSESSEVRPVEREGPPDEQRRRWGPPRAWRREEWEARWKRPGAVPPGPDGADQVESLLPYVEELDALRPKSPPPRNGLPSSGGLGRGRGAGLGITRSGLIPHGPSPSAPSPPNGLGRGRGRGRREMPGFGSLPFLDWASSPAANPRHSAPVPPGSGGSIAHFPSLPLPSGERHFAITPPAFLPPPLAVPPSFHLPPPPPGSYPLPASHPWVHHPLSPQYAASYVPLAGTGGYAPPLRYPLSGSPPVMPPAAQRPGSHSTSLPLPMDPAAVQAHLAHLQQQQHALAVHLTALQLSGSPSALTQPQLSRTVRSADGGVQGLVYPIGGPNYRFDDAQE